ncbi:MAG: c-type cytochrome [Pseudohongiellaceae bacterium]
MNLYVNVWRGWFLALLVGGCVLVGGAGLSGLFGGVVVAEDAGNLYDTAYDVRLGRRYFERQCSRCHGFDATGNDETGAPDITGRLTRASTDTGVFNIIRNGIEGTAMLPVAADLPDATVWQLVAFINSLSRDFANIDLPGDAVAGERLFTARGASCDDCHMVSGVGGRLGPDLSTVAQRRSPEELMSDLIDPDEEVAPRWWQLRITTADGGVRQGFRMNESSFSLHIMDIEQELWSFRTDEIEAYERIETSTMPGYAGVLNEEQLDDLVAYLFSLRKEIEQ